MFTGTYNGSIKPNPSEVSDYCFKKTEEIKASMQTHPAHFTEWFKIALPKLEEYMQAQA